jgi:nitrogen fixation NifU-like protein
LFKKNEAKALMNDSDNDVFSETAQDHARDPRHFGPLPVFNGHAKVPGGCGDIMEFWVYVRSGELVRASFDTNGCGSSLACGSMAACLAQTKKIAEVMRIGQNEILDALGGLPERHRHCAQLAANALRAACEDYRVRGFMRSGKC